MTYESRRNGSLLLLTLSIIAEKYIYSKASVLSSEYLMTIMLVIRMMLVGDDPYCCFLSSRNIIVIRKNEVKR